VANYLERPEALHALRDTLFAEDHRQPIALTALAGMGGIGKTVLAKALTDDEVVREAFPDGIVWITAGKERKRDFMAEIREVAKALGDDLSGYDNDLACENRYRTTIANKAALIVVDDVWSKTDIEPLLAESPRSRFLFTTRDAAIGNLVGARDHRANLLDDAQARELLALWANKPFAELPAVAGEIIRECGRLPLALSVLGGMLRGKNAQYWADTLARLRKADISSIKKQLPTGQETFFKAVETSFQSLEPDMQERYKALAVLLEDMSAPLPILATLLNVDTSDARLISNRLVELSLAQFEGTIESIRLHDLQLDYVRAQHPDKEALDLIQGATRLSSNVIEKDPGQFASQIVGRLMSYQDMPAIEEFTTRVAEGTRTPWLRELLPVLHPPGTGLLHTLAGHSDLLNAMVTAGDHRALSASDRGGIRTPTLCDMESLISILKENEYRKRVNAVVLTPNGQRAVSASFDTLKVWDLVSGRELLTLSGHSREVNAAAVTPDGQRAVSASSDNTLKVWDLVSGRELRTLTGHSNWVNAVAVSPDGQRAVSASNDQTLRVWDLETGRELHILSGHTDSVTAVALTSDGQRAVSVSNDQTLGVWDLDSGCELHTLTGHPRVHAVAVTPDGQRAVSASYDHTLRVWDLDSGLELHTLTGHSGWVNAVAMMPDGQRAVSASFDNTLKVWDLLRGCELHTLAGHTHTVNAVAVMPDGQRAVSASYDKTLKVWNVSSGCELRTLAGHTDGVSAVRVTSDGQRAISASGDGTLRVWQLSGGRKLRGPLGHRREVMAVAVASDAQRVLSASADGTVKVWDLGSGCEMRTIVVDTHPVTAVAVTPDGQQAISASYTTLKAWDVESGRELFTLTGHHDLVMKVALSSNGERAVSADGRSKTLKVWDLVSGRELCTLTGHTDRVTSVAVTPDGLRAVSASEDQTLRVWDLKSGRELNILTGHLAPVIAVAVTPDGRGAVSTSWDRTLRVWDLENGREELTLRRYSDWLWAVAVSPEGRFLATCDSPTLKVWNMDSMTPHATFTCDAGSRVCAFAKEDRIILGDSLGHLHFLRLEEPKPRV
jgi:WD40 repeat protein